MAKVIFRTSKAKRETLGHAFQGLVSIYPFAAPPFPDRTAEAATASEAAAAFAIYQADAAATGEPLQATMRLAPGERAPRGFRALKRESFANV